MRTGRNVGLEIHRVRAKLRRLSLDFARSHEQQLANWTHHSDADLERLWEASHPQHWRDTPRAQKRRRWNFEDLLDGEIGVPDSAELPDWRAQVEASKRRIEAVLAEARSISA